MSSWYLHSRRYPNLQDWRRINIAITVHNGALGNLHSTKLVCKWLKIGLLNLCLLFLFLHLMGKYRSINLRAENVREETDSNFILAKRNFVQLPSNIQLSRMSIPRHFLLPSANTPTDLYNLYNEVPETHNSDIECILTKTTPKFPICVYESDEDKFISAALRSGGFWEPHITDVYQRALAAVPDAFVIDIGANIGYYTLLAIKMGHMVIAVEPYWESVRRFHKSIHLNNCTSQVLLAVNAVSDMHENVTFIDNVDNQGGVSVRQLDAIDREILSKGHPLPTARTIFIDDILDLTDTPVAIIKLDIEGYECKAMGKATTFLDTVYVPYIFMEWKKMFVDQLKPDSPCPTKSLQRLCQLLTSRGYAPYEVRTHIKLNPERSTKIWRVGDIYWRHKSAKVLFPP
ncbi:uncharacterized protein LOC106172318 [Lingula anatina]|uniref:Uncharacterized protein LOC106172318 n=1 Tax=Lingula anatina TaxID=7574 RepID=A0A1S3JEV1_LINAN|nr:uncharacterized protein LOC106172318 [Lingula anatina]|eukprot:XP_013408419.1 uncharacterized protein LOC106172318 [Lingula anatina]